MAGVVTPVVSPDPYANVDDLTEFWKETGDDARALSILKKASNRLRVIADNLDIDLDGKVNASPAYFNTVQWVVMEATKRAMLTPTDAPPANSIQKTAGPYSENIVFTNPAGDLWFKKTELQDLGLQGAQKLTSISTVPGSSMYDPYESS
jgi:hypothetical protein